MRLPIALVAACLLACLTPGCRSVPDDNRTVALFDGSTFEGWVQRGGKASYRVEDGAIVGSTAPNTANTFLCTEKEYGDFDLQLEFKVDSRMNSGVQCRSLYFE